MLSAVYISEVSEGLRASDIEQLVADSQRLNSARGISGFLVRAGPNFIQYLEGDRARVAALLRRMETDPRHRAMKILAIETIGVRRFDGWSMRYFYGEKDGSVRLESFLHHWSGDDAALINTVVRICSASQRHSHDEQPAIPIGSFSVLLKDC
ncbi:BLUF domain-containing protein [Paraburkholderia sp. J41]|uniref:BLUF domain-containing protein n=1 Tax=Paraburkholderia sp. J41 TaxID=2805433 RepID=UPI002AC3268E|nr:BLUF domain-containing protein [Paraburkholderia sp. J41]